MSDLSPPPPDPSPQTPGVPAGWYYDSASRRQRWWDGTGWTESFGAAAAPGGGNGFAVAALILGIVGFVLTPIPLFIGLLLGVLPCVLAVIFGIVGIVRARAVGGRGLAMAIVGLALGGFMLLMIPFGAGTIW